MSTSDLLTKLVLHEKQIVTYRTLSRQQAIHVNQAKTALAEFYHSAKDNNSSAIHATFIVTGLARPKSKSTNGAMDDTMDLDIPSSSQPQEADVTELGTDKVVMCTEETLEATKADFARVRTIHVYSLSAAPIKDASTLATAQDAVRATDAGASQDQLRAFGVVIGDVSVTAAKSNTKGKSKAAVPPSAPAVKPAPVEKKLEAEEKKVEPAGKKPDAPEKKSSSRNGTLNSGAAKPKEEMKSGKEATPPAKEVKVKKEEGSQKLGQQQKTEMSSSSLTRKRGLLQSEDEGDAPVVKPSGSRSNSTAKPKSKQRLPVKQEEEQDEGTSARRRTKKTDSRAPKAQTAVEASLAAMFDESSDVEMKPTAPEPAVPEPAAKEERMEAAFEDDERPEEEPDESEAHVIDKPQRKRRAKPKPAEGAILMKDGRKKRRVVKSRMTTDEKGYMGMEDYSEYETVSESEELTVPEKARKSTAKKEAKPKETVKEEVPKPKPKPKPTTKSGGKAGGKLSDYFAKK
ncbi:hypothetical protein DACRYDRAFT_104956 [Dacryopinax primogenitus]|uniref:DNA polymerase delta subunit 3 n=1 Tax=Dacryopinax primogenitus (strain DJM 731) TaxID=1858805 RepID=M5GG89_DACPD|nr:uncharacterized protein DACRYDRAFT_104956 [Dacryopinax primogenitus]EJU05068.1 hypothetical protein DACRYDRAFT_104956 [Dacryopinax primogenitus]